MKVLVSTSVKDNINSESFPKTNLAPDIRGMINLIAMQFKKNLEYSLLTNSPEDYTDEELNEILARKKGEFYRKVEAITENLGWIFNTEGWEMYISHKVSTPNRKHFEIGCDLTNYYGGKMENLFSITVEIFPGLGDDMI